MKDPFVDYDGFRIDIGDYQASCKKKKGFDSDINILTIIYI
jgi:hypothetical protein